MTDTHPKIADELQFDLGQHVRIRMSGRVGMIVKVYRRATDREWQYMVKYHGDLGFACHVHCEAHEIMAREDD